MAQLQCILPYAIIRKPAFSFVRFRNETILMGKELDLSIEKPYLQRAMRLI